MNSSKKIISFYLIFTLSGFSGLIYESIWSHYLKLFLGHAAYAQALVLAIFMGGMALGAWLAAKFIHRISNLFIAYALIEAIIGLLGLGFHNIFGYVVELSYSTVFPSLNSPVLIHSYKWSIAALLILPQSILLGMTFPLMANGFIRFVSGYPGRYIAMLYFCNSIGAAIGVLTSGFYLIAKVGLPGTIMTAGILNILLAMIVYFIAKPISFNISKPEEKTDPHQHWPLLFLIASFITGMASFIYEIAWIRMLSMVLGSSTHAFELMLSAFITGLALGGLYIRKYIDKYENPVRVAGIVQITMGILALATVPLYNHTFDMMAFFMSALERNDHGYILFNLFSHVIALLVMFPAAFCAGMTLPLFTYILLNQGYGEKSIGHIYSSNTLGAILGIFFCVYIGMPVFGLKGAIYIGALLDILLGIVLHARATPSTTVRYRYNFLYLIILVVITTVSLSTTFDTRKMASGVFRYGFPSIGNDQVLFHEDGRTASISVSLSQTGALVLRTNGKPDASINTGQNAEPSFDEYTMILLAAISMSLSPDAETVANIGLGSGMTAHTFLTRESIKKVDTIEIEPEVANAGELFRSHVNLTLSDKRSAIHIEDAKTFFATYGEKYDIIVSEPSNPWVSGVASLFTDEFYNLVKRYLQRNGIFVQWIHTYELNEELLYSILKALANNFPDYRMYAPNDGDLIIIASLDRNLGDATGSISVSEQLNQQLEHLGIINTAQIELMFLGDSELFNPYIDSLSIPVNSDYFPIVEQHASRSRYLHEQTIDFHSVRLFQVPFLPFFYPYLDTVLTRDVIEINNSQILGFINNAYTIMDYVLGKVKHLDDKRKQFYIDTLQNPGSSCDTDFDEQTWTESIYVIIKEVLSFLPPQDIIKLHDAFTKPCESHHNTTQMAWLDLMLGIGSRDPVLIVQTVDRLTSADNDPGPDKKGFLITAAFVSLITEQRYEEAMDLWPQYLEVTKNRIPFVMRVLHAKAETAISDGKQLPRSKLRGSRDSEVRIQNK